MTHPIAELVLLHGEPDEITGGRSHAAQGKQGARPAQYNSPSDPPCDTCPMRAQCARREIACDRFLAYVRGATIPAASRLVSRGIFNEAMRA